jgi:D-alanine-D-alanine ligase-like ATP-grasp enzyme
VDDADAGLFTLSHGGRRVRCRESLSDLTSAISMSLCQDKSLTHKVLKNAGLKLPAQQLAGNADDNLAFLDEHQRVVVKPLDGEQGQGVAVDLQSIEDVSRPSKPLAASTAACCWKASTKASTCAFW